MYTSTTYHTNISYEHTQAQAQAQVQVQTQTQTHYCNPVKARTKN
jgi:hypothetical protein